MAWLEQDPKSNNYKICFRYGGRRFKHSLKSDDRKDAETVLGGIEKNLLRLEQGLLEMPEDADVVTFLLSDGKRTSKPQVSRELTLSAVRKQYLDAVSVGAMEESSVQTLEIHLKHFDASLGKNFPMRRLSLADLQEHVRRRAKAKGIRNRPLSPTTMKKEIASLRAVWNWAVDAGIVEGSFPCKGLKYPKSREKPPFQTWQEIQQQIERGGLDEHEQIDLWDCLYLTRVELDELLAFVSARGRPSFVYPMFCFAAYTGARRSEMMRLRWSDIDLETAQATLHEKKRVRGKSTTRRVPLTAQLVTVLGDWRRNHPGGAHVFSLPCQVPRSRNKRTTPEPLTRDQAADHFKRALASSKWARLRGWHVLRHTFISLCASEGIDQRMIDEWSGHQTDEMRRRYRHLFPSRQKQAIELVFGKGQ